MANETLKNLEKSGKELQRPITVNAGVLIAALREIQAQSSVNGEGVLTRAVIFALEEALKK